MSSTSSLGASSRMTGAELSDITGTAWEVTSEGADVKDGSAGDVGGSSMESCSRALLRDGSAQTARQPEREYLSSLATTGRTNLGDFLQPRRCHFVQEFGSRKYWRMFELNEKYQSL